MITTIILLITGIGVGYQIIREFKMRVSQKTQTKIYYPTKKTQPRKKNGQFKKILKSTYTGYRESIGLHS